MLLIFLAGVCLSSAGCAPVKDSHADGGIVHGSAGVRFSSRDTSRVAHEQPSF
jgi:hypothetical protein